MCLSVLPSGCVAHPRMVSAIARRRALSTTSNPAHLHKRVCHAGHWQPVVKAPLHSSGQASRLDCVAPRSNMPHILPRRALPAGRLSALGATRGSHHGPLGPQPEHLRRIVPQDLPAGFLREFPVAAQGAHGEIRELVDAVACGDSPWPWSGDHCPGARRSSAPVPPRPRSSPSTAGGNKSWAFPEWSWPSRGTHAPSARPCAPASTAPSRIRIPGRRP